MPEDSFSTWTFFGGRYIPHYYGHHIRALLLVSAVLSVVSIPLFGDLLPFGILPQVGAAIVLVMLAGLMNPHSTMIMTLSLVASGLSALLLESAAISLYRVDSFQLFVVREVIGLMMLFAFYFSIKTLRAMILGKIGKVERPWEFEEGGTVE